MFLNEMNGLCEMKEVFEMTKKITMNRLNDNQLEMVAGGSSDEIIELYRAFRGNSAFQKDYPILFAPPVNQEYNIDGKCDEAMGKALLEKLGIKAQLRDGIDYYLDCNIYTSADTGKRLYHTDVINAIKNYKG